MWPGLKSGLGRQVYKSGQGREVCKSGQGREVYKSGLGREVCKSVDWVVRSIRVWSGSWGL